MFGTYRTILALSVMASHLISIHLIGTYAVLGFFILSGYLMTFVMSNSYGYSFNGVKSFAINRFLRLYPSYWVILIFTVLIVLWFGEENSSKYRNSIFLPDSPISLVENISLIYFNLFPWNNTPRLSPPSWALTVELLFYLLIALGISKSKKATTIWFACSLIYMSSTHLFDLANGYRHGFIIAGTLPFSLGAMIYHYRDYYSSHFLKKNSSSFFVGLVVLFFLNSALGALYHKINLTNFVGTISFYSNYLINAAIVLTLIEGKVPYLSSKADKKIGDFSYPIYLMHWQVGFLSSMLIWSIPVRGFTFEGIISFALTLALCFCISYLIIRFVDIPIESIRRKIKKANKKLNSDVQASSSTLVS